jgi:quercetin 2,3-dioxygenase
MVKTKPLLITRALETVDGAGVRLRRVVGNPELSHVDPFVLLDEIRSENPEDYIAGFPTHPHRGIETVTYMIEGNFRHKDSRGGGGLIARGDVQWMTAGRGILHSEMPEIVEGGIWGYQLWLSLPRNRKMTEPRYQAIESGSIPTAEGNGSAVKVIAGEYGGKKGPAGTFYPVHYFDVRLRKDEEFAFSVPKGMKSYAYVHTGNVRIGPDVEANRVHHHHFLQLGPVPEIRIHGNTDSSGFLFLSAAPLDEPIVRGGPFVMNTKEELYQAFRDWETGHIDT